MTTSGRIVAGFVLAALGVGSSACGYALAGRASTMPDHIRRIGVPMFVNQSATPDLDQIITQAVRTEISGKGRYLVVYETTGVDAVLSGVILGLRTNATGITETRQASKYLVTLSANVEFREQPANTVYWSNPSYRMSEEYDVPDGSGATDQTLLFQADRQGLERLARNFARSLVASIFEGM
jgi:hypothetical protein